MTIRFLADENTWMPLVDVLVDRGTDVIPLPQDLRGAADPQVVRAAYEADRVLITGDRGIGRLVATQRLPSRGVVTVWFGRFDGSVATVAETVADRILALGTDCRNVLTVLEPSRTRVRPLT